MLYTVQRSKVCSVVYGIVHHKNPWSYLKRVGHSLLLWLSSVAILPWLCRKRRKAIFTQSLMHQSFKAFKHQANWKLFNNFKFSTFISPWQFKYSVYDVYYCWPIVCDAGPTLNKHWINISCFPCLSQHSCVCLTSYHSSWSRQWPLFLFPWQTNQTWPFVLPVSYIICISHQVLMILKTIIKNYFEVQFLRLVTISSNICYILSTL